MNILDEKFESNDFDGEITVREYMFKLLEALFLEGECFSGKRPFGNSGWEHDIIKVLIKTKMVDGSLDEDGFIEEVDDRKSTQIIIEKILKPLFGIKE